MPLPLSHRAARWAAALRPRAESGHTRGGAARCAGARQQAGGRSRRAPSGAHDDADAAARGESLAGRQAEAVSPVQPGVPPAARWAAAMPPRAETVQSSGSAFVACFWRWRVVVLSVEMRFWLLFS
jgi:hypothetical protein